MKATILFPVLASALVAAAKPSHSFIAALQGRQPSQDLHARSGVDPSSIASQCQSSCSNIVKTLDACTSASCECTQNNFNALGVCINCLVSLSSPSTFFSPGDVYLTIFQAQCEASGAQLKSVAITATPTGSPDSTVDPLSPFEVQVPTGTDLSQFSATLPPLVPTPGPGGKSTSGNSGSSGNGTSGKSGLRSGDGAIGLSPVWALGMSAVVAIAVAIAVEGVSFL